MTDLRTAAQQALEALKNNVGETRVVGALRAALAQQAEPVQEPIAWRVVTWSSKTDRSFLTRPEALDYLTVNDADGDWHIEPVLPTPPQRKPLTVEEIESCRQQGYAHAGLSAPFDFVKAARAVEAKHGIKESP
jgi:hypothetical protein